MEPTMETSYCENCDKKVASRIVEREIELLVRGEPTKVLARVRICDSCGEECYDEELENTLFKTAYDLYRRRHNIVFPEEIRAIREKYGLSQRGLAVLLGWGEITIHRYEGGSIADEAHNQLLHLLKYPENMLRIVEMNGCRLPASSLKKLRAKLDEILCKTAVADKPKRIVSRKGPKGRTQPTKKTRA
jgi:putative zinc finger/helix-turn-helix YgiT family protein